MINDDTLPIRRETQLRYDRETFEMACALYREMLKGVSSTPVEKVITDTLDPRRSEEQLKVLYRYCGDLSGKLFLEIGCGFGTLLSSARKAGIEAFGLEPDPASFAICSRVLTANGLDASIVNCGSGEKISYGDGTFDIVYLNQVIEHVADVGNVLSEAIRVTRPGGRIISISPNYGSFFEGHYGLFWIPYMPKFLARPYVKLFGRRASYLNGINMVTMRSLRGILRKHPEVQIKGWGVDLWEERMDTLAFSDWAELGRLKQILALFRKLGLIPLTKLLCRLLEAYNPLIITMEKVYPS